MFAALGVPFAGERGGGLEGKAVLAAPIDPDLCGPTIIEREIVELLCNIYGVAALERIIIANARYWLDTLDTAPEDVLIPEPDIRGAARALEAVMTVSEAWALTLSLALALHPRMERRGYWTDWDGFLSLFSTRLCEMAHRGHWLLWQPRR